MHRYFRYTTLAKACDQGKAAIIRNIRTLLLAATLLVSLCSKKEGGDNPVTPPAGEVTKKGTISNAETWAGAGKVYHVIGNCSIEAQVRWGKGIVVVIDPAAIVHIDNYGVLTIEENVTVRLRDGAYIEAGGLSPGTLVAAGSASAPIVFKADTGAPSWGRSSTSRSGGIILGDSAKNCCLNYCTITGAVTGIYAGAGSPVITNCKISSCNDGGIRFDSAGGPVDSLTFTNDTISGCGVYPLTLPAGRLGNFSGTIVFADSGEDKSAIRVLGTIVEDSAAVWKKRTLPYCFTGTTIISSFNRVSRVTVMPGTVCGFEAGACIRIGDPGFGSGTFIAKGVPADSIFFVNYQSGSIWGDSGGGILIGPESPANSVLEYCSIQNATTGVFVAAGAAVTVSHCRLTGCENNGITFAGGGPVDSLAFQDDFCVGNAGYGIGITADRLADLSGVGSVAGNGKGGIFVTGAQVWQSGAWKKYDAPYIVEGVLDIGNSGGVEITIAPGTEFDFLPGASMLVGNSASGTLVAVGSDIAPVVFTSFVNGEYWGAGADGATGGGIRIEGNAETGTTLDRCTIRNATSGVYVNAPVKIQNCLFQNNRYFGLIRDKNAALALISGNSYSGNGVDSTYTAP